MLIAISIADKTIVYLKVHIVFFSFWPKSGTGFWGYRFFFFD